MSTIPTATASSSSTSCRARCGRTTSTPRSTGSSPCQTKAPRRWSTAPTPRASAKKNPQRRRQNDLVFHHRGTENTERGSPLFGLCLCGELRFEDTAADLVALDRLKERAEIALAEAFVALAIYDFEKDRADHGF